MIQAASDILLIAGSLGLAVYCWVLSRRLRALGRSDAGLGATIAALSERVEALTRTTQAATAEAESAAGRLAALIEEADRHEGELSVILAGLTDMDDYAAEDFGGMGDASDPVAAADDEPRRRVDDVPLTVVPQAQPEPAGSLFHSRRMAGALR